MALAEGMVMNGTLRKTSDAFGALSDEPRLRRAWHGPYAGASGAVLAATCWSYAPNIAGLYRTWSGDPNYSHGFFVVPVALVILYERLRRSDSGACRSSHWWWAALAVVLGARALFYEWGLELRETATIPLVLLCLALAWGGRPFLGRAWPALAFLVFMLPLPRAFDNALAQPLQHVATTGTCLALKLSGLWVVPEGNVILVGKEPLEVAEACNGLSMLMCLAATVAATTVLLPMAAWKRVALLASIVPVALASNILRITATSWCYSSLGAETGRRYAHDAAGWFMMPTALLLVMLELAVLTWLVVRREA